MIRIGKESRIYIYNIRNQRAGGIEVLYMLAAYLKRRGARCKVFDTSGMFPKDEYYSSLYDYDVCDGQAEIDLTSPDTVIVLPEVLLSFESNVLWMIRDSGRAQIVVWWLSSNISRIPDENVNSSRYDKRQILQMLKETEGRILHMCESELAYRDLGYYGNENRVLLQHGTNRAFYELPARVERKNLVLYNAYKAETAEYVKNVLAPAAPDLQFVEVGPLADGRFRDKREMCDLYDSCKCYVDFCTFVGRELMPREACLRGCLLVLNNAGNAATFEDYPIPRRYKVDRWAPPERTAELIRGCLADYDRLLDDFTFFKSKLLMEPEMFRTEADRVFMNAYSDNEKNMKDNGKEESGAEGGIKAECENDAESEGEIKAEGENETCQ